MTEVAATDGCVTSTLGAVTINEADAFDLVAGGLSFADNDTVTLDLQSEGTYLSSKLASAGLTLGALGNAQDGVGVDILDIGGESTRPGAPDVSEQEELDRVIPVVERMVQELDVMISLDTSKAAVMREGCKAGAHLINDVRALLEPGEEGTGVHRGKAALSIGCNSS